MKGSRPSPRFWATLLLGLWLLGGPPPAFAEHAGDVQVQPPVRIGVLSFRPKPETLDRWQHLTTFLAWVVHDRHFELLALSYPEMDAAIAAGDVDFILTQPSHYVTLTYRNALSSPLATLIEDENGLALDTFGGVIFTRADRNDIARLGDLKGQTLATVGQESLGGYQTQAFELLGADIHLPRDASLLRTGLPQDQVIEAVLAGRADAGFVRTGVIEALARAGKLDPGRLKVLNRQDYVLALSTRLYPQWAFAAVPGVGRELTARVSAALLTLPAGGTAAKAMGIHGFTTPADYRGVDTLLRALRLPPFDKAPAFTFADVWSRYRGQAIAGTVAGAVILLLAIVLFKTNRRLRSQRAALRRGRQLLEEAGSRQRAILQSLGDGVFGMDRDGRCTFVNRAALSLLGYREDEMLGRRQEACFSILGDAQAMSGETCPIRSTLEDGETRQTEAWLRRKEGAGFHAELTVAAEQREDEQVGAVVVFRDVSARKAKEQALLDAQREIVRLSARNELLLDSAGEGIYGVDTRFRCTFINPAALRMVGYARSEIVGQNPHRIFHHHDENGNANPDDSCPVLLTVRDGLTRSEEVTFTRRNGEVFPVQLTVTPIIDDGERVGATVVFQDISQRKAGEDWTRLLVSALEAAGNAIMLTDANARIEWINTAFERLTGYSRHEVVGRRPAELFNSGRQADSFYEHLWKTVLAGGTWHGELTNRRKDGSLFCQEMVIAPVLDEAGRIRHFVASAQDVTERKGMVAELEELASTDPLTGLANRRRFFARVEEELARIGRFENQAAAILMMDLDHFKSVNDVHGHARGDAVLKHFAAVLREPLRKIDLAGRLGGEEFALLLPGAGLDDAHAFAERLRERVETQALNIGGAALPVTVSIGVTVLAPYDESVEAALARADAALYAAKQAGRNRVEVRAADPEAQGAA